jgi:5-methyltetrahydrofolate corrinoid/iron sulfur protein methyltransferase
MQIIGEKINGTRPRVGEAIINRDKDFITNLAIEQVKAGANLVDINAGTTPDREAQDLVWAVELVQKAVDVPLCLDSTNPAALTEALKHITREDVMINSINGEENRLDSLVPIVAERGTMVIGLAMDESGIPKSVDDRLKVVRRILARTREAGIADNKVYIDPLIMTIATDTSAAILALQAMRAIKTEYPEAHITAGMSNVSFGLPVRSLVNRTFLTLAMEAGLDSAIADPSNRDLREAIIATEALLGRDPFCRRYTSAFRQGLISGQATGQ